MRVASAALLGKQFDILGNPVFVQRFPSPAGYARLSRFRPAFALVLMARRWPSLTAASVIWGQGYGRDKPTSRASGGNSPGRGEEMGSGKEGSSKLDGA